MFWTKPAEATHDWPDFGDVTGRQPRGAMMLCRMTGLSVCTESARPDEILALIHPDDGALDFWRIASISG